ncbi:arylamine N-acetyltransferase [Burkholderia ubonensis]|uniref:arylamine N-acetyltransferase n=1 Tax=Burkholderia ubonensis TaxID=101571 RepID=UPI00138FF541|nr:arylamine N-acetyltransferase [Burkholderia ubonensis]
MSKLGYLSDVEVSPAGLARLFDWYLSLGIPYETLSNLASGVLIKNAGQMLAAVLDGGGGHCVEHSVLLEAVLHEAGFDARLINADYHDERNGVRITLSKPLVVVRLDGGMWVCDPYYRNVMLPVPDAGALRTGEFEVTRVDAARFVLARIDGARVVDADHANLEWPLAMREAQFRTRYRQFSPFGVTAPFYQVLRPVRQAIFYSPRDDALLATKGASYQVFTPDRIDEHAWVPAHVRAGIAERLAAARAEREDALRFLESGLFPPFYERLQRVA